MKFISFKKERLKDLTDMQARQLEAVGIFVEGEAISRCPVDTGNLRGSITHRVNYRDRSVEVGSNVEYAVYVEKGTRRNKAQPYLRPAAEDNLARIRRLVEGLR